MNRGKFNKIIVQHFLNNMYNAKTNYLNFQFIIRIIYFIFISIS